MAAGFQRAELEAAYRHQIASRACYWVKVHPKSSADGRVDSTSQYEAQRLLQGGEGLTLAMVGAYLPNSLPSGRSDFHIVGSKHLMYV